MSINKLYCGDNIEIMRGMPSESVDLIYTDPPFFTQKDWKDFDDRFEDIESYVAWLRARVYEMHRVLKPTGSIYCHLDWHAVHYLKVEMDKIFGYKNFRNEIIWCYSNQGRTKTAFPSKHDTILVYGKTKKSSFYGEYVKIPYREDYINQMFNHVDDDGNACRKRFDAGKWRYYYPDDGMVPNDWWADIYPLSHNGKERLGYPTQKPEALLERIIKASSNKGDTVFDPFCGCGTTLAVAKRLKRNYIGIDINQDAIDISTKRLIDIPTRLDECITYANDKEEHITKE